MAGPSVGDLCRSFEEHFPGAPKISKVADVLNAKIPSEKELRTVLELVQAFERLFKIAPDPDKMVALVNALAGLPPETLRQVNAVLKTANSTLLKIDHIMAKMPGLDLATLMAEFRKPK